MSISSDLDEVSTIIVCPYCIERRPKYWIARYLGYNGRPKRDRPSKVFFLCLNCGYKTQVLHKKLIQFIEKELTNRYYGLDR